MERLFPLLEGSPQAQAPMDVVLLLSVRAGFGGQKFNPVVLDKASGLTGLVALHTALLLLCTSGFRGCRAFVLSWQPGAKTGGATRRA